MDQIDGRYTLAREHWELRERVATVEAEMRQIGPALARIETALAARSPAPQAHDSTLLALHDVAKSIREAVTTTTQRPGGGLSSVVITFALIGVGIGAFLVGKLFF